MKRTDSLQALVPWYSIVNVFVYPTSQDNFPTTNLEALASGIPVITYDTGGSPEAFDELTGIVVNKGDVKGFAKAIIDLASIDKGDLKSLCRVRAETPYNKDVRYLDYLNLYDELLNQNVIPALQN